MPKQKFHHLHDTALSSGFRFLTELVAWIAGPWAASLWSKWLIVPAIVLLVGLPAVFSTPNDKKLVIVPTPGPARIAIELFLYSVAATMPWLVWPPIWSAIATGIVIVTAVIGIPRMLWLLRGAPETG